MSTRFVVPNDASVIHGWAEDFAARYGVLPIGGGEVASPPPAAPAAAAPAPAAPDPGAAAAPAAPAAPQAQPAAPAAPAQQPGAPVAPEPGAAPVADETPPWAKQLLDGMGQLVNPPQVDPLAAELFGFGNGQAPAPGPDPAQAAAQQQMPGGPFAPQGQQQPGALPGQPAVPGQVPGQPVDPTEEAVLRLIDERAREVAARQLQEQVMPLLQQQEGLRQRQEWQQIFDDYPELKDPKRFNEVVSQARAWSTETLGDPSKVREPGYFETCLLAMKGYELTRQAAAANQPPQPGAAGEVPIEGAGGGNPGAAVPQQTELAQQIVDAGPGGGLNNLWV